MKQIGTFFGYSALSIASTMPSTCTLTCIEGNAENAAIAQALVTRAFSKQKDILERINIVTGLSSNILSLDTADIYKALFAGSASDGMKSFDFVFLDHDKDCYLPDLLTLEKRNLLDAGTCLLIADNVIFPGAPDYLSYVGYGPPRDAAAVGRWSTALVELPFERIGYETKFQERRDAMSISHRIL